MHVRVRFDPSNNVTRVVYSLNAYYVELQEILFLKY